MEGNSRVSKFNVILIVIAIVSAIMAVIMINMPKLRAQIETTLKSTKTIENSYTEETTNQVDISKNGDGSVIATLAYDGTLTISGNGEMKDFSSSESIKDILNSTKITKVIIENGITNIGSYTFMNCYSLTDITIPSTIITLGNYAFYGCSKLSYIVIPSSVTSIGHYAFHNCSSLISINIPENVTKIDYCAFNGCSKLKEIKVNENNKKYVDNNGVLYSKDKTELVRYPEGKEDKEYVILEEVKTIKSDSFSHCTSLIYINIPEGVTVIGARAFEFCSNLTSIDIPAGVTSISANSFDKCSNLTAINVDENNTKYMDDEGVLYTKDKSRIVRYPEGKYTEIYTILEDVTQIGEKAFYECENLTKIEIPSTITDIGNQAFFGCRNLTELNIPEGVTNIGVWAFWYCKNLIKLEIHNNVTNIGKQIFYGCQVLIIQDDEVTNVPDILKRAQTEGDILYSALDFELNNCIIEEGQIILQDKNRPGTIKIKDGNLAGLEYVMLYNKLDVSKNEDGSVIASLDENGVLTITGKGEIKNYNNQTSGKEVPWYKVVQSIREVEILEGVTKIGNNAFDGCNNLKNVKLSEGLKEIGDYSFERCTSLEQIEIPASLIYISVNGIFKGCSNLTEIKVNENNEKYCSQKGILYTKDKTEIVRYPEGKNNIEYTMLEGVKIIGWNAFSGCSNLTKIAISNTIEKIETYAFEECKALTNIVIPEGVTSIDGSAFLGCSSLTSINIPSTVTNLDSRTFYNCRSLMEIKINENNEIYCDLNGIVYTKDKSKIIKYPEGKSDIMYNILEGVTSVQPYAFSNCTRLTSVTIPDSVTSIEFGAFYDCTNLIRVNIPDRVTSINSYTFKNCTNLTNINIPEGVTSIGSEAFAMCYKLDTITIHKGVTEIGENTFYGCKNLMIICDIDSTARNYAKENAIKYLATRYNIVSNYIKGIQPDIIYENLKNNIDTNMEYQITEDSEGMTGTTLIKTGQKLTINNKTYTLVVTGDINGDGKTNIVDLSRLKLAIVGKLKLEGEYKEATDINSNGQPLQITDLSKMKLYIVGKTTI